MEEGSKKERNKPSQGENQKDFDGSGISARGEESSVETQYGKLDEANGKNIPKLQYEHNLSYSEYVRRTSFWGDTLRKV